MNRLLHSLLSLLLLSPFAWAEEEGTGPTDDPPAADQTNSTEQTTERHEQFAQALSGATLVGHFTTLDNATQAPGTGQPERYDLLEVTKSERGDWWIIRARIRYGQHDLTMPIPVEVKWAGNTPVITVDEMTVPGLGTFDARVIIRGNRYAGTWQHDQTGGHLFGILEPATTEERTSADDSPATE